MKKIVKISTLLSTGIVASIPTSLTSCSTDDTTEVHILHINDIHGQIPGYGDDFYDQEKTWAGAIRLARDTQDIISRYPGSIFLSGGDSNSMGQFANCNNGDSMYPVMSAMDIRYSVVGNHAWDYGGDKLENYHFDHLARTNNTVGNYFLTSNIVYGSQYREKTWESKPTTVEFTRDYNLWKETRIKWADPYKIIDMNGHNVAIIGLTTQDVYTDGKQSELKNIAAIDYISSINYTKKLMLEENGKDAIDNIDAWILLTHCAADLKDGAVDPECDAAANIAAKLDQYSNIDGILCGHSHKQVTGTIYNKTLDKDIWLGEGGWKGEAFIDTKLSFDDSKPKGQRLKEISMEIKKPSIKSDSFESAKKELEDLALTTTNDVVKATIETYNEQKEVTKKILDKVLGESQNGLNYSYSGAQRGHQSETMVDQAGAWSQKSQIGGFNEYFKDEIENDEVKPVSIGLISSDSVGGAIPAGDFKARDVYKMFQFENYVTYGVLTYHQLEQMCNYIISGATATDAGPYDSPFYYDNNEQEHVFESQEEYAPIPWNPYQWYGFSFEVTKTTQPVKENNWRDYEYKSNTLKIYDPENNDCNLEDPGTWKNNSGNYWDNKYIAFTTSNFLLEPPTGRIIMCKLFGEHNGETDPKNPKIQNHYFKETVQRELVEAYCNSLKGSTTLDISEQQLGQLFIKPKI